MRVVACIHMLLLPKELFGSDRISDFVLKQRDRFKSEPNALKKKSPRKINKIDDTNLHCV